MRKTLSVAIVTYGEEVHLERTLEWVSWADEIVIVDSGGLERTKETASRFNARFFDEP
jgi:glycosyltransferase involved in cell wall biosynthesis